MNLVMSVTPLGNRKFVIEFANAGVEVVSKPIIVDEDFFIDYRLVDKEAVDKLREKKPVTFKLVV